MQIQAGKQNFQLKFRAENFFGDFSGNLKRSQIGLDNEMPIGERVKPPSFLKKLLGLQAVDGKRTLAFREPDIAPAMLKGRFEPDGRKVTFLYQAAIFLNRPRAAAERNNPPFIAHQNPPQILRLDKPVIGFARRFDNFGDSVFFRPLNKSIEVNSFAVEQRREKAGDRGFAHPHKARQNYSRFFVHQTVRRRKHKSFQEKSAARCTQISTDKNSEKLPGVHCRHSVLKIFLCSFVGELIA